MKIASDFLRFSSIAILFLSLVVPATAANVPQLLEQLDRAKSDTTRLRVLKDLAWKHIPADPTTAQAYGTQLLELAQKTGDTSYMIAGHEAIGLSHHIAHKDWESLATFKKAMELARATNNAYMMARMYNLMGIAFDALGYMPDALSHYQEGMRYAKQAENHQLEIRLTVNTGVLFNRMQEAEKAIEELERARSMLSESSDGLLQRQVLANLASAYIEIEDAARASELLDIATVQASEERDQQVLAFAQQLRAEVAMLNNQPALAIEHLEAARSTHQKISSRGGEAEVLYQLGLAYAELNELSTAVAMYKQAYEITNALDMARLSTELQKELSETWQRLGDYQQALTHLNAYVAQTEANATLQKQQDVQRLEYMYNLREKQELLEAQEANNSFKDALLALLVVICVMAMALAFVIWRLLKINKQANERLKQVNKLLWERSNARSKQLIKLAHYNAHEVRGPLARIQGLVSVLRHESKRSKELQGSLHMLETSAHDLDRVIKHMNDVIHKGPPAVEHLKA